MKLFLLSWVLIPTLMAAPKTEDKVVEHLQNILENIRARVQEAEAAVEDAKKKAADTVEDAKDESKDLLAKAEREAEKIKAEAGTYVEKISNEIKEIQEKTLGSKKQQNDKPSKKEISKALEKSVDPLMTCWEKPKAQREKCAMGKVRQAMSTYFK